MAIETTTTKSVDGVTYPKLRYSLNYPTLLVFFTTPYVGIVLQVPETNSNYSVGEYRDCWNTEGFKDFEGTLSISNKKG